MKDEAIHRGERSVPVKQPNSKHCFVCGVENPLGLGLEFYESKDDRATAEVLLPESYQGYPGIVHGGIVAAMLDEIAGRAAMIHDHTHFRLTARLDIRYRLPVPIGEPLRLLGWVVEDRGRLVSAHAEITLADGRVAAEAEALLADLPDAPETDDVLAELGWRVYPDAGSE